MLFARELQRRATACGAHLVSVLAHPGVAHSNLARTGNPLRAVVIGLARLTAQSAAAGALPSRYAATAAHVRGGEAFGPDGFAERRGAPTRVPVAARGRDEQAARRLWAVSEQLTGVGYGAFAHVVREQRSGRGSGGREDGVAG